MSLWPAVLIALSLSIDAFAASFAYGSEQIKIPARSIQTINIICSAIIGVSMLAGNFLQQFIPAWLTTGISFTILFLLGIIKLLDSISKSFIHKYTRLNRKVNFSMFNLRFILELYITPEKADIDNSKTLSPSEAASLAVALSLDGIAVGFGASLAGISALAVTCSSLVTNIIALYSGMFLGNQIARKTSVNVSWVSGVVLIVMAISKIL